MFGDQTTNDLAQQLCALEEEFQLKKLTHDQYENSKVIKETRDRLCAVHFLIAKFSILIDAIAIPFGKTWTSFSRR